MVPDPLWWSELGNEENWRGSLRYEVKSGQQVKAIASKYLAAENQSARSKAVGDLRPFAFIAMPDGWGSEGLVVVRKSVFQALLRTAGPASSEEREELDQGDHADRDNDDSGLEMGH